MKRTIRNYIFAVLICLGLGAFFYFVGGEELRCQTTSTEMAEANSTLPEIVDGVEIRQKMTIEKDIVEKISIRMATYARANNGILTLSLVDNQTGKTLEECHVDVSLLPGDTLYEWEFSEPLTDCKGKTFTLTAGATSPAGSGITFYINQNVSDGNLSINNETISGMLCYSIQEKTNYWFGEYYWYIVLGVTASVVLYLIYSDWAEKKGKITFAVHIKCIWNRYGFLIKQLVSRDFKTKYKRSALGYLWSFLNPLLSMLVQYIVFSTLFQSDIENFPVYLLTGIVLFNFFSDAVGQGLGAIVINAALITKVYVPKYIYPVTKVASSSINLLISIIPLFIVMLLTGQPFRKSLLLLPFPLICLLVFCVGMSLLLSSSMVFFRDTQYLWGIVSLAWTYATPIFYPADIIPDKFILIQKLNPLYHYIRFTRELLIAGVSPSIQEYVYCIIFSVAMLAFGAFVFKKTQDKFILYI